MTDPTSLAKTESFLHEQIPLSKAMGVRVESHDSLGLVLTAPLEPNHNHLGNAFGGSLGALATLAAYSLLWLELGDRECHIVIRSSSISYEKPVHGPLRAICRHPAEAGFALFKDTFRKKGKARILLHATLEEDGQSCVLFEGVFVAIR